MKTGTGDEQKEGKREEESKCGRDEERVRQWDMSWQWRERLRRARKL